MPWILKFTLGFAIFGSFISLGFGLMTQNSLTHVLVTALISMVVSGALGGGVYRTLELRVPEFLELLEGSSDGADDFDNDSSFGYGGDYEAGAADRVYDEVGMGEPLPEPVGVGSDSGERPDQFGDHLLVNKIKIKNEPKLMAEAIKTMLARDES